VVLPGVDEESGRLDFMATFDAVALQVDHDDVGRGDLRPVQALGIDQEAVLEAGRRHAEVVADALGEPEAARRSERRGEVDPSLSQSIMPPFPSPSL
jgi:hypothetical protein